MSIAFGRQVCGDLDAAAAREWLVADGVGGYAMGTVAGLRTRRYHGAAGRGRRRRRGAPDDRASPRSTPSSCAGDRRHPPGHARVGERRRRPGGVRAARGLRARRRAAALALAGRRRRRRAGAGDGARAHRDRRRPPPAGRAGGPVRLELTPLCTWRDAHGERRAGSAPAVEHPSTAARLRGRLPRRRPGLDAGRRVVRAASACPRGGRARAWPTGRTCGLPARFAAELEPGEEASVAAWAGDPPPPARRRRAPRSSPRRARAPRRLLAAARARRRRRTAQLVLAADEFVVDHADRPDVVAGYPWFGAWSRDTMTSYEGLFLDHRARTRRAARRCCGRARTVSEGMLANTADTGTLEYNTADATLWFLHAVDRHVAATGDDDLAAELAPAADADRRRTTVAGTRYGIGADPADGLLRQGAEGVALTWMDARVDGRPVTARVRQGRGDQRAVDQRARGRREPARRAGRRRRPLGRPGRARPWRRSRRRFRRADGLGLLDVVDGPAGRRRRAAAQPAARLLAAPRPGAATARTSRRAARTC